MGAVKILVVDDEESVLRFAETVLRTGGYDVLPASDAQQALRILDNQPEPADILLSDVRMPGISGPQLVMSVKESFPGTALVFMSGHVGSEEVEDESEPFDERFPRLVSQLHDQFAESTALQDALRARLNEIVE